MRVAVRVVRVQPDDPHQLLHPIVAVLARLRQPVDNQGLSDDAPDRHARIQRGVWVLEDHLHVPPHAPQLTRLQLRQVLIVDQDVARSWLVKEQDHAPQRCLPAATLAHQPQRLTALHVEGHSVDRLHVRDLALEDDPGGHREVHLQVPRLDEVIARPPSLCSESLFCRHVVTVLAPTLNLRRSGFRRFRHPCHALPLPAGAMVRLRHRK